MKQFPSAHTFIDETGSIAETNKHDFRAVGGVVIFGVFGPPEDQEMRSLLEQAVIGAGGKFPADLHGSGPRDQVWMEPSKLRSTVE
jgi:hypothetical protein